MTYKAPVEDMSFLLKNVFDVQQQFKDIEQFQDFDYELYDAVLEEGLQREVLGQAQGVQNGEVGTLRGVHEHAVSGLEVRGHEPLEERDAKVPAGRAVQAVEEVVLKRALHDLRLA